ncbi:hypothetical protein [Prosthecochloris sp.]|uniref:hypothetical protein n=1 Tax=Prosthecochloris sp. TaxID=290513 RepID=UPI0025F762ED|nr:hypothetical protein [Prosthecochloris sp.]
MINTKSMKRGIYAEVAERLKEKGIELKVPTLRMRIVRGIDPVAMEIYAEILHKRIEDHARAADKLSKAAKKLEEVS